MAFGTSSKFTALSSLVQAPSLAGEGMTNRTTLLLGAAILALDSPSAAQQAAQPQPDQPATSAAPQPAATTGGTAAQPTTQAAQPAETGDEYGDEEIVVTGQRPRGSVVGDIPPEDTLDSRAVRATGATNINELLEALAPQIGSAQGRGGEQPVLLLNGQRVSSFREMRDIPTEAIERVEILPEEVALKYGYRADQKVVNIVLRPRFRSTVALGSANAATEGGYAGATGDLTRLLIGKNGRTTFNLHATGNGMLTEDERNIILSGQPPAGATEQQELAARSLIATNRDIRGSATFNRTILGDVSGTLNTEVEHQDGRSLIGLGEALLEPLPRNTSTDSAHAGITANGDRSGWHWNLTGNADLSRALTSTLRDDPDELHDRARETNASGDFTLTANGKLFKLPAGDATTTLTLGGNAQHLDSHTFRADGGISTSLSRTTGEAAVNLDLPVSRRNRDFSALGNLTLNANAEVDRLSDAGTLTTIGAGANFSPTARLNFITSWTREEGAPTMQQLGDPLLETPNSRIFDFVTGQTALVNATTGGNPELLSDKRNVFKLGTNWQPFENTDFRLRADYVHQTIQRPISNITVTPQVEAAFPDRFVRDSSGELVSVDLRPVNFDSSRRDVLRVGFDFTKPLKSKRPSQSVIDQIRAQFGGARGQSRTQNQNTPSTTPESGGPPPAPPPESAAAGASPSGGGSGSRGGFGGGRGFGGGGGFFGGGSRGRLTFSLTDSITFVDKVTIAPGIPELDYLHGDAAGSTGATPRHTVQAQFGWSNNGLGARIGANWRSATNVNTATGDNLHFSPLGTFDLRLFMNPGDMPEVALAHPWLRGTQIRLDANNVFDAKPNVHDAFGNVPLNYQADLLDPLGRTIMITLRKLFLPSPAAFRRLRDQEQQQQQQNQSR
jgi:uncharacterized membrane protein YgcG